MFYFDNPLRICENIRRRQEQRFARGTKSRIKMRLTGPVK